MTPNTALTTRAIRSFAPPARLGRALRGFPSAADYGILWDITRALERPPLTHLRDGARKAR